MIKTFTHRSARRATSPTFAPLPHLFKNHGHAAQVVNMELRTDFLTGIELSLSEEAIQRILKACRL